MKVMINQTPNNITVSVKKSFGLVVLTFIWLPLCTVNTLAQLKRSPIPKQVTTSTHVAGARTMGTEPLHLPFLDDFSKLLKNSSGIPTGIPDTSKWENSRSVWVNNGMGIDPPSVYVATFDGLDSTNLPYEPSQLLLNGATDKMVSKPINLSEVAEVDRSSVYLSYYYQWKGNGEAPDPNDYLQLEFKNDQNVWETISTIQDENPTGNVFNFQIVQVDNSDARFFHDSFQFRFIRYGRKSGPFDTWNIDYVYLDKGRNGTIDIGPDFALSSGISSLFTPYRAVPIKHFFAAQSIGDLKFVVSNMSANAANSNYELKFDTYNYYTDPPSSSQFNSDVTSDFIAVVPAFSTWPATVGVALDANDVNQLDPDADSINVKIKLKTYSESNGTDIINSNDTLSAVYKLKDYYAYDDGVAEYSVILNQPGNQAVMAFDMVGLTQDTIVAIDVYFPDFGVATNQTLDLSVYEDDGGKPADHVATKRSSYSIQRKGLNVFSRVSLQPAVVSGRFYIGWTEPSNGTVKVGLDVNNDNGDKIFVKTGSNWSQNADIKGSLMIRPVFGSGEVITGIPEEYNSSPYSLFPNPNNGSFFIRGKCDQLEIFNVTGTTVPYSTEDAGGDTRVTLQTAAGLYLVKIKSGKNTCITKMIIR